MNFSAFNIDVDIVPACAYDTLPPLSELPHLSSLPTISTVDAPNALQLAHLWPTDRDLCADAQLQLPTHAGSAPTVTSYAACCSCCVIAS